MPGIGERLWDMGKSPPQNIGLLVFGLASFLVGLLAGSLISFAGTAEAVLALSAARSVLFAVGGFFVTLSLFLWTFAAEGGSVSAVVWRVALLLASVLVLIFVFV